jgi:hypothetical protein
VCTVEYQQFVICFDLPNGMFYQITKGKITKDYFPRVAEKLNMKISANPKFTTMVTGLGNIKAYLHRFKIAATPTCPSGKKDQTTDHLLYECEILKVTKKHFKVIIN